MTAEFKSEWAKLLMDGSVQEGMKVFKAQITKLPEKPDLKAKGSGT